MKESKEQTVDRNVSNDAQTFIFVGDAHERGGPKQVNMFGIEFPRGEPVEVTDKNVAKKLAGNQEFMTPEQMSQLSESDRKARGIAA